MARASSYEEEFRETAALAAQKLGLERYEVGFQSSPDVPPGTWLGPDVVEVIGSVASGAKAVLVVPVGFICDHVEVLFDLDIEAREAAEKAGTSLLSRAHGGHAPRLHRDALRTGAREDGGERKLTAKTRRVVVLGGGVTGLVACYRLLKASKAQNLSLDIHLIEASHRLGGVIETEFSDGVLMEKGPGLLSHLEAGRRRTVRRTGARGSTHRHE